MNVTEYEVGDRLLVSPWNRDTHAFDDGVFEVTVVEFSPKGLYVLCQLITTDAWFPCSMLLVREKLEPKAAWDFTNIDTPIH